MSPDICTLHGNLPYDSHPECSCGTPWSCEQSSISALEKDGGIRRKARKKGKTTDIVQLTALNATQTAFNKEN
jgi:hypothetical protein